MQSNNVFVFDLFYVFIPLMISKNQNFLRFTFIIFIFVKNIKFCLIFVNIE